MLKTKFSVPRGPTTMVSRGRLLDALDAGVQGPLTLLAAPAGAGKSALLSSWVAAGRAPGPVAWLSLDGDDADRRRFWRAVLGTLSHATGDARLAGARGQPARAHGHRPRPPGAGRRARRTRRAPRARARRPAPGGRGRARGPRTPGALPAAGAAPGARHALGPADRPRAAATRRLVDRDPRARSGLHARRGRCAVRRARRAHRARRGRDAVAAHRRLVGRAVPGRHVGPRPPRARAVHRALRGHRRHGERLPAQRGAGPTAARPARVPAAHVDRRPGLR